MVKKKILADIPAVAVRKLAAADYAGFLALMKRFYVYSGDKEPDLEQVRPLFRRALDPGVNYLVLVAAAGAELVGMLSLTFGESSYKAAPFAWCDDFYVDEKLRVQGIGKILTRAAMAAAKKRRCSNILCGAGQDETAALKFYERAGFKDMRCKLLTLPLK
jgi:ribosomal protein S18 acetylase RimI-like enzyme